MKIPKLFSIYLISSSIWLFDLKKPFGFKYDVILFNIESDFSIMFD